VSIGLFCEVSLCTNTSKCSLFDALKTAENDCHVFENLEVYHTGGREIYSSVSPGPLHKVNTCTNAHKSVLLDAVKTAENDCRIFENLEVYHAGTRRRGNI